MQPTEDSFLAHLRALPVHQIGHLASYVCAHYVNPSMGVEVRENIAMGSIVLGPPSIPGRPRYMHFYLTRTVLHGRHEYHLVITANELNGLSMDSVYESAYFLQPTAEVDWPNFIAHKHTLFLIVPDASIAQAAYGPKHLVEWALAHVPQCAALCSVGRIAAPLFPYKDWTVVSIGCEPRPESNWVLKYIPASLGDTLCAPSAAPEGPFWAIEILPDGVCEDSELVYSPPIPTAWVAKALSSHLNPLDYLFAHWEQWCPLADQVRLAGTLIPILEAIHHEQPSFLIPQLESLVLTTTIELTREKAQTQSSMECSLRV